MNSKPSAIALQNENENELGHTHNRKLRTIQVGALLEPGLDQVALEREERTVRITFRLSKREAEILEAQCSGIDRSRFIRAAIFSYPIPRPRTLLPQIDRDTYIELGRIGGNLNQQSRAMNEMIKYGLPAVLGKKYLEQLEELRQVIAQIRSTIATKTALPIETGSLGSK